MSTLKNQVLNLFLDNISNDITPADMRIFVTAIFDSKENVIRKLAKLNDVIGSYPTILKDDIVIIYNDTTNDGCYLVTKDAPLTSDLQLISGLGDYENTLNILSSGENNQILSIQDGVIVWIDAQMMYSIKGTKIIRDILLLKPTQPNVIYISANTDQISSVKGIIGDGYSWDGTKWNNIGQLRGTTGEQGTKGEDGIQGETGQDGVGISQLEVITEGSNTGWRIINRDTANYADIGSGATDLSFSNEPGSEQNGYFGASGDYSFTTGFQTQAPANYSVAFGSWNVGRADTVLEVGIGTTVGTNALEVYSDGRVHVPSFKIADITNDRSVITKEWADIEIAATSQAAVNYIDFHIDITKTEAIDYTDQEVGIAKTEATDFTNQEVATAKSDAITYTDQEVATAKSDAITYTDQEVGVLDTAQTLYTNQEVATAKSDAITYTDQEVGIAKTTASEYTDQEVAIAKAESIAYTDTYVDYTDQEVAIAKSDAITYTDTEIALNYITADLILYVETTGNDTTGDGSIGTPYASPHKALEFLSTKTLQTGVIVTVQLGAGEFNLTESLVIDSPFASQIYILGEPLILVKPDGVWYVPTYGPYDNTSKYVCTTQAQGDDETDRAVNIALTKERYETILNFTGCDGLVVDGSILGNINNVAILSDSAGTYTACNIGLTKSAPSGINFGLVDDCNVAILGWDSAIEGEGPANINCGGVQFGHNTTNLNVTSGFINFGNYNTVTIFNSTDGIISKATDFSYRISNFFGLSGDCFDTQGCILNVIGSTITGNFNVFKGLDVSINLNTSTGLVNENTHLIQELENSTFILEEDFHFDFASNGSIDLTSADITNNKFLFKPEATYDPLFSNGTYGEVLGMNYLGSTLLEQKTHSENALVDTTNFSIVLSETDTDVQTALETLDNIVIDAVNTPVDTTNFNNNLSGTDTDVQKAFETLDDILSLQSDTAEGTLVDVNNFINNLSETDVNVQLALETLDAINYVASDTSGDAGSDQVLNMVSLTQAEYEALTPQATTFYIIIG